MLETDEIESRRKRKPQPKFDPETGKWVVRNWDGTIAGVENGHLRCFDKIGTESDNTIAEGSATLNQPKSVIQQEPELPPFAKIETVLKNSPAMEAGLLKGDLIFKFGTIDYSNNRKLKALGELVANARSTGIILNVGRNNKKISLKLHPRQWSGKGLVGCTFSPTL